MWLSLSGFIGYAKEVAAAVADHPIQDTDDDQLYYTQLYLDQEKRVSVCWSFCVSSPPISLVSPVLPGHEARPQVPLVPEPQRS